VIKEDELNKLGFEGDPHVFPVLQKLVAEHKLQYAIETGTFFGNTTVRFTQLGLPVATIESQPKQFAAAFKNLKNKGFNVDKYQQSAIWMVNAHSQNVLGEVIKQCGFDRILFYLDAHWESHLPLLNELDHIANANIYPVIVIHDFFVPIKDFGFDTYHGQRLDFDFIKEKLDKVYPEGYSYFYNEVAEGHKRGLIFIYPE